MGTILASCLDCGDVELKSSDLTVRVRSADSVGSYHFMCPCCDKIVTKSAEPRVVELLVTSGVRLVVWHDPEELEEQIRSSEGDPISHDDILDFHTLMMRDDWLDMLRSMTPGDGPTAATVDDDEGDDVTEISPEGGARRLLGRVREVFRAQSKRETDQDGPGGDINKA